MTKADDEDDDEPRQRPRRLRSPEQAPRASGHGGGLPVAAGGSGDAPGRTEARQARQEKHVPLPSHVKPATHSAFLQWLGTTSGKIHKTLPWGEWCTTVAKRFSAKSWAAKLEERGLTSLPAGRTAMIEQALQTFVNENAEIEEEQSGR